MVRRLGFFTISEGFDGKWDDTYIHEGGIELSLFQLCRQKVREFVENKWIENIILGMTIFLCVVIFTELATPENTDPILTQVFYFTNFFLLSFFMVEILLKLVAFGTDFLAEFINTFDSIIVIISFVFLFIGSRLPILGLLRTLRLLKVIASMKKIQD